SFFDMNAANKLPVGDKSMSTAQMWMEWPARRSYEGMIFEPGVDAGSRWFNMWRGFAVKPSDSPEHPMVERWKEHLFENICGRDAIQADWLTGWFAHLVQRPYEKPLVAIVFRGDKGVGKNALVERVSKLLGGHAMTTARRRYLVSNFTRHLQYSLLFVLDEAFWSGDKEAEGVVKDLVTGSKHQIEPKGKESYTVRNLTRVVVIGNEEWLVPASADERRWAVFDVGDGRKQDRKYFEEMRLGLDEQGGSAHLLRYLMDYKIAQDVNQAPNTAGLVSQKISSLEPVQQWWYDTLSAGMIAGGDWGGEWPDSIPTNRLRDALRRWVGNRNIKGRLPNDVNFGKILHQMAPSFEKKKLGGSKVADGDTSYAYLKVGLDVLRSEFDKYIGGGAPWNE
ncbi:MAG: primase-helicase family protein, partial [Terracidiphilus sp.]